MSYAAFGQRWGGPVLAGFRNYVEEEEAKGMSWVKGVTFHHTAAPRLATRPEGLRSTLKNVRHYYEKIKGWRAGPHLFADDIEIHGLTPLHEKGTHAKSFNRSHIGIEVLGAYDLGEEDPTSGRGLQAWRNAARAAAIILDELGLSLDKFNFHRDDQRTDKTCPGMQVTKGFVRRLMSEGIAQDAMLQATVGPVSIAGPFPVPAKREVKKKAWRGSVDFYEMNDGTSIAPIARFLAALGVDGAYDSGNWNDVEMAFYDEEQEVSYGTVESIVAAALVRKDAERRNGTLTSSATRGERGV